MMTLSGIYYQEKHNLSVKFPHYIGIYEELFAKFRDQEINILEIGNAKGGFLQVLKKYFSLRSNIYGLNSDQVPLDDFKIFYGYQQDKEFLKKVIEEVREFSIIIDDGSHEPTHQIDSFETLFPVLTKPGLYIVEDTQLSYAPMYGGYKKEGTFIEYIKDRIDDLNAQFAEPYGVKSTQFTKTAYAIHIYFNLIAIEKREFDYKSPVWIGERDVKC